MDYKKLIDRAMDLTDHTLLPGTLLNTEKTPAPRELHETKDNSGRPVIEMTFNEIRFSTLEALKHNIEKLYRKNLYSIEIKAYKEDFFLVKIIF